MILPISTKSDLPTDRTDNNVDTSHIHTLTFTYCTRNTSPEPLQAINISSTMSFQSVRILNGMVGSKPLVLPLPLGFQPKGAEKLPKGQLAILLAN